MAKVIQLPGPLKPDPDAPRACQAPELLNPALPLTPAAGCSGLSAQAHEVAAERTQAVGGEGTRGSGAGHECVTHTRIRCNALASVNEKLDAKTGS
jgi:hypothetical protein